MQKLDISIERRKQIIEKMARGAHNGFWLGTRPHEKPLLTMAGYMFNALENTEEGQKIIFNHEQLELPL